MIYFTWNIIQTGPVWSWLSSVDFQLTLSANSKVDTENTKSANKLGACDADTLTHGVGKIGLQGPLPLAQSASHSIGITARATFNTYIHTYIPNLGMKKRQQNTRA